MFYDRFVAVTERRRLSAGATLRIAIAAELVYIGGRTLIRANVHGTVLTELVTTAWRLVLLAFYGWVFFGALKAAWQIRSRRRMHPLLAMAVVASVLIVLTAGYWPIKDPVTMLAFAATTPVVALREEISYRFLLQDGFEQKMSALAAICLSSLLFVASHVGVQPINPETLVSITSLGVLLGVVYQRTKSLRLAVAIHVVVDLAFIASISVVRPVWTSLAGIAVLSASIFAWALDRSRERMGV